MNDDFECFAGQKDLVRPEDKKKERMRIVLENIRELVQVENYSVRFKGGAAMSSVRVISDAYLIIQDGLIEGLGLMKDLEKEKLDNDVMMELDCTGRLVFPSYCDARSSFISPSGLERAFTSRTRSLSCDLVSWRSEGIQYLAQQLERCDEDELYELAEIRLHEMISTGTGAIGIKSGYGFTTESELKILRVIRRLREAYPVIIRSTFLGAHSISAHHAAGDRKKFMDVLVRETIPQICEEGLDDCIDVFCDHGFFSIPETEGILTAAMKYELKPKFRSHGRESSVILSPGYISFHMSPEETINAMTLNSAYSMGIEGICGSICKGKVANVFVTAPLPGYASIPYFSGARLVDTVILDGKFVS